MSNPVGIRWDVSVTQSVKITDFLNTKLPLGYGEMLLHLGAIYRNRKRCSANIMLSPRDALRVHLEPRRFDITEINFLSLLIANEPEYLVVNKPAGIPVHPTCDNSQENLLVQLEMALKQKLWVVHRLDISTSGLMILGKTKRFCNTFQKYLEQGQIRKEYHCLLNTPVPEGRHEHFMPNKDRGPFHVFKTEEPFSKRCILTILSCNKIIWKNRPHWIAHIHLITGRHHQIRSQMAALESPIVGDLLYGSKEVFLDKELHKKIALQSTCLEFCDNEDKQYYSLPFCF